MMATRNSVTRRLPGNALGGVLRATALAARSTTRRSVSIPGPEGPPGVAGPCGPPATAVAAVLTSDDRGVARWDHGDLGYVPVIVATPVADVPVFATLRESDQTHAEFLVWHLDGTPWIGATLHAMALQAAAPDITEALPGDDSATPID